MSLATEVAWLVEMLFPLVDLNPLGIHEKYRRVSNIPLIAYCGVQRNTHIHTYTWPSPDPKIKRIPKIKES